MNVLVDTPVWVGHFKRRNDILVHLLNMDRVLTHPMVVVELACGTPPEPRSRTLDDIGLLLRCNVLSLDELRDFVERERLYGLGRGLVDMALLGSTVTTPNASLWTLDKRLANLAGRFGVRYRPESDLSEE